jgi:hypothetical protein
MTVWHWPTCSGCNKATPTNTSSVEIQSTYRRCTYMQVLDHRELERKIQYDKLYGAIEIRGRGFGVTQGLQLGESIGVLNGCRMGEAR